MNFPISISRMSLFQILGCLVVCFIFIHILIEHSVSKQWTPVLIWVSAVCVCPTKRMLGLYGLNLDCLS